MCLAGQFAEAILRGQSEIEEDSRPAGLGPNDRTFGVVDVLPFVVDDRQRWNRLGPNVATERFDRFEKEWADRRTPFWSKPVGRIGGGAGSSVRATSVAPARVVVQAPNYLGVRALTPVVRSTARFEACRR